MSRIFGQSVSLDMVLLWTIETVLCFLGLYAAFEGYHGDFFLAMPAFSRESIASVESALLLTLLIGTLCIMLGVYKPSTILSTRTLAITLGVAALCAAPVTWAVLALGWLPDLARLANTPRWVMISLCYWFAFLIGTRLLYAAAMRRGLSVRDVVVAGDDEAAAAAAGAIRAMRSPIFRVSLARDMATPGGVRPWKIVVAGASEGTADARSWTSQTRRTVDVARFWEIQFGRVDLASMRGADSAALVERVARAGRVGDAIRRGADIGLSAALLVLVCPLMLLTALAIKLDSPGPVIYRQARVGRGGRDFTILKFRSMRVDAEHNGVAVWARVKDSRVSRVGRFIRLVRIDELPQLLNILRGDMSLVGPRPERPAFAAALAADIPLFDLRTLVKPGLTGWAQVNSAYAATAAEAREKLSYDLYYIKHRSLLLDAMVILATIRVVIFQTGSR